MLLYNNINLIADNITLIYSYNYEDYIFFPEHIILENLTGKYKHPCVVDLKLGTRTYSDIMSDEKKQKHSMRCASTTSGSLGVRLGGMQVLTQHNTINNYSVILTLLLACVIHALPIIMSELQKVTAFKLWLGIALS